MKKLLFFFLVLHVNIVYAVDFGTVLMYHRFEESDHPSTNISEKVFREHLVYLKENNYNVLPLEKLIDFFKKKSQLPEKSVFITVDDGYKSFYKVALPILLEFKFPFSIFISTDYVSENPNSSFMNWKMLNEVKNLGGSIYNHVSDHSNINNLSKNEIIMRVEKSNDSIKKNLGINPIIFSYPYGISNLENENIIKNLGFELAFSQHSSHIFREENIYRLPRFAFNEEFGNLERFKMVVNSYPLEVYDLTPKDTKFKNDDFRLGFSTNKDINKINCYSSDLKLSLTRIPPSRIEIKFDDEPKKGINRVNCTSKIDKKIFWYGRILIN